MNSFTRYAFAATVAVSALAIASPANAQQFALKSGDHVVTYGDSITAQCLYSNFAEAFVLTRYPKLVIDWTTAGWGGDRVGGGGGGPIDVRLQRDVLAYNPTMVTVMLGMNDGSYRAFDQGIFDTYAKGYQHIVDVVKKANPATAFTLIQPSPFDDITQAPQFPGGYNGVLIKYSAFVKDLAQKNGFLTADFNTAVDDVITKSNTADPADAAKIIPGRVHPSPAGHLIMAETLVKSWNFPSLVASVTIDGTAGKLVTANNATVTNVAAGPSLKWDELDNALPLPWSYGDPVMQLVVKNSDFLSAIDQEPLSIINLTAPKYTLNIDGKPVGTFTKEDLASGVNLAGIDTPMLDQANNVLALTNKHVAVHMNKFHSLQAPFQGDNDSDVKAGVAVLAKALDSEDQSYVVQQRAAAQPTVHHFELVAAK